MKNKLIDFGYNENFYTHKDNYADDLIPARITAVFQGQYEIATNFGTSIAKLKGSYAFDESNMDIPTVGDFVMIDYNENSVSIIHNLLSRKSSLIRKAPNDKNKEFQIIAANVDFAFIVMSLNKDFNSERLIRYTTAIYDGGITPVVVLSKSDLLENDIDISEYISKVNEVAFGVDILVCSTYTGDGIDEVKEYLKQGKTYVFLGSSGVGKSSLLNAIAGDEKMAVSAIREDDDKGKHTTTHRQLFMLDNGSMIIDTPGMREFALGNVDSGLSESFADIEELASQCFFKDCTHDTEPKCAVKEAIANGTLNEQRLKSYNKHKKIEAFYERRGNKGYGNSQKSRDVTFGKMVKKIKAQKNHKY